MTAEIEHLKALLKEMSEEIYMRLDHHCVVPKCYRCGLVDRARWAAR